MAAALSHSATTPVTDESLRVKPRTTRVSQHQPKPRGHCQSFLSSEERHELRMQNQRQSRERKRARAEAEAKAWIALDNPDISVYDLLMCEFALQPSNKAAPISMQKAYEKQLYSARPKHKVPRQRGVQTRAVFYFEREESIHYTHLCSLAPL